MRSTVGTVLCSTIALASVLCQSVSSFAEPPNELENDVAAEAKSESAENADAGKRVSVAVARERAKLTHNIYTAALDAMHHRYFRGDRTATIPARAMEDVFSEIAREENIKAKWISVNTRAMSIDHRPEGDFEKQAAREIADGETEYELVENGVYRRAEGISLMNRGCLGCHLGFGTSSKTDRFAGLVITIPVTKD